MARKFVADPVVVYPVRNLPSVATFTFEIDVPQPLPPPLTPPYPPHKPPPLIPPLSPEPLPLILLMTSNYDFVAYKEYDLVVEFHQNNQKEYVEETRLKYVHFCQ